MKDRDIVATGVIELENLRGQGFRPRAIYVWRRKLWMVEPAGCLLCSKRDEITTLVSLVDGGPDEYVCKWHGALIAVVITKTVSVDGFNYSHEYSCQDLVLFPLLSATPGPWGAC